MVIIVKQGVPSSPRMIGSAVITAISLYHDSMPANHRHERHHCHGGERAAYLSRFLVTVGVTVV